MEDIIKERNEAFSSMDEEKIRAYCKKCKIEIPEDDTVFWAGVHKTVCDLFIYEDDVISLDQFNESFNWLIKRGFTPSITGGEG